MNWSHLPEPGGIYAQHPDLLERFEYIFTERARYEAAERAKKEREQDRQSGKRTMGSGSSRGPRPRRR